MKLFTGFTLFVAATSALKFGGKREQGKLKFFSHARIKRKNGIEHFFKKTRSRNSKLSRTKSRVFPKKNERRKRTSSRRSGKRSKTKLDRANSLKR
jgi:hypothetical protein